MKLIFNIAITILLASKIIYAQAPYDGKLTGTVTKNNLDMTECKVSQMIIKYSIFSMLGEPEFKLNVSWQTSGDDPTCLEGKTIYYFIKCHTSTGISGNLILNAGSGGNIIAAGTGFGGDFPSSPNFNELFILGETYNPYDPNTTIDQALKLNSKSFQFLDEDKAKTYWKLGLVVDGIDVVIKKEHKGLSSLNNDYSKTKNPADNSTPTPTTPTYAAPPVNNTTTINNNTPINNTNGTQQQKIIADYQQFDKNLQNQVKNNYAQQQAVGDAVGNTINGIGSAILAAQDRKREQESAAYDKRNDDKNAKTAGLLHQYFAFDSIAKKAFKDGNYELALENRNNFFYYNYWHDINMVNQCVNAYGKNGFDKNSTMFNSTSEYLLVKIKNYNANSGGNFITPQIDKFVLPDVFKLPVCKVFTDKKDTRQFDYEKAFAYIKDCKECKSLYLNIDNGDGYYVINCNEKDNSFPFNQDSALVYLSKNIINGKISNTVDYLDYVTTYLWYNNLSLKNAKTVGNLIQILETDKSFFEKIRSWSSQCPSMKVYEGNYANSAIAISNYYFSKTCLAIYQSTYADNKNDLVSICEKLNCILFRSFYYPQYGSTNESSLVAANDLVALINGFIHPETRKNTPTVPSKSSSNTPPTAANVNTPNNTATTSAGTLKIDNPSKLFSSKPVTSWDYALINESNILPLCAKGGFVKTAADFKDFFAETSGKTTVITGTTTDFFVMIRMLASGKTMGTYQHYAYGKRGMIPSGIINKCIYFKDDNKVVYHSTELSDAISQELVLTGISHVGIMYDNGNMSELIVSNPDGSPADLEYYSVFHKAGSYNLADYNIKFYPNSNLGFTMTGVIVDEKLSKYRARALDDIGNPVAIESINSNTTQPEAKAMVNKTKTNKTTEKQTEMPSKVAPKTAALTTPCYIIGYAAVADETIAKKYVTELTQKGFTAGSMWVPDYEPSGKAVYRVYVGPYKTLQEANTNMESVKKVKPGVYVKLVQ